jgi:hypothetical protein
MRVEPLLAGRRCGTDPNRGRDLDRPTGLQVAGHWYTHQAGDYDDIDDDGLPREVDPAELRWS